MPIVVAIVGRKGGQGKSTLAVSLAAGAVSGKRPGALQRSNVSILVDGDSQANSSRWALGRDTVDSLGRLSTVAALEFPARVERVPPDSKLLAATTRKELAETACVDCLFDAPAVAGLRVVPASPRVHPEDVETVVLAELPGDVVVVDTGADCSVPFVRSAIRQADYVLCPTAPEPWGCDGVDEVIEEIRSCGRSDLFDSKRFSVVISRRERVKMHDVLEKSLRENFGTAVSRVVIPKSTAVGLVCGGPEFFGIRHALRGLVADLWAEILGTFTKKELAA